MWRPVSQFGTVCFAYFHVLHSSDAALEVELTETKEIEAHLRSFMPSTLPVELVKRLKATKYKRQRLEVKRKARVETMQSGLLGVPTTAFVTFAHEHEAKACLAACGQTPLVPRKAELKEIAASGAELMLLAALRCTTLLACLRGPANSALRNAKAVRDGGIASARLFVGLYPIAAFRAPEPTDVIWVCALAFSVSPCPPHLRPPSPPPPPVALRRATSP